MPARLSPGSPTSPAAPEKLPSQQTYHSTARESAPASSGSAPIQLPASSLANGRQVQAVNAAVPSDTRYRKSIHFSSPKSIHSIYEFGGEVMPSCHRGMKVVHATRKVTGEALVIKLREKALSFGSRNEEKEWRQSTELMLNLPDNETICALYDVLEDHQYYYVIMEKADGLDLFETLAFDGPLAIDEVRDILIQLLTALYELHASGCIHRDLKLENVMVDRLSSPESPHRVPSGLDRSPSQSPSKRVSVKLIDFDTVQPYSSKSPKKPKDVLGTDQYIAQEAYDGHYSPASDIFAVGVIGYKLLTGRFPFRNTIFDDEAGENWVGSPKMRKIQEQVRMFSIDWSVKVFQRQPGACALLQSMLHTEASERPDAYTALNNPWLQEGQLG